MKELPDWSKCPDWYCMYDANGCDHNCNHNCDDCNVYKEQKCRTCDFYPMCYPNE